MDIVYVPTYEDIFSEEKPELSSLLKEIPSELVIKLLAYISAQIYINDSPETQIKILKFLLESQPIEIKTKILKNVIIFESNQKTDKVSLFGDLYLLDFIKYELLNFRNINLEKLTSDQELNILKSYFLFLDTKNHNYTEAFFENRRKYEGEFFPLNTWPTLINQVDITYKINPNPSMIKAIAFFNYLQYHSPYNKYVDNFLKYTKKSSSWDYVFSIMKIMKEVWNKNPMNSPFSIKATEEFITIFEYFSVDVDTFKEEYANANNWMIYLKEKPLISFNKESYIVINWNFLANKVYDGLMFDFYKNSGINKISEFNKFTKFKKYISYNVSERFVFKRLITAILDKKYAKLLFEDDNNVQGMPDAYFRDRNRILLFEFKDAYFPSKSITSLSYEEIKDSIDQKYNNDKKGTGQIIKQIQQLIHKPFDSESYENIRIKRRNSIIFPIMFYNDRNFGLPGINNYLINELNKKLLELDIEKYFKKIQHLTFINLNFLIRYASLIKKIGLINIIESFHQDLKTKKTKANKFAQVEYEIDHNETFEEFFRIKYKPQNEDEKDIKILFKALDLAEGLPKN